MAEQMQGPQWVLEGEAEPRAVVWGNCIEINLHWYQQVTFHDGEVLSWNKVCLTSKGAMLIYMVVCLQLFC